jgi:hypothetical protein
MAPDESSLVEPFMLIEALRSIIDPMHLQQRLPVALHRLAHHPARRRRPDALALGLGIDLNQFEPGLARSPG